MNHRLSSYAFIFVAFSLAIGNFFYAYQQQYFLRFIPLPIGLSDIVNRGNWLLPSHQDAVPMGNLELPNNDLTTEIGLRKALNFIQEFSPTNNVSGLPTYEAITFDKWVKEIQTKPFFCTDATQLFILTAWKQGLVAREWHLLPPHWPPGQGHSVAEFYNPKIDRWQLVDAQHAAIIRKPDNKIIDMVGLLNAFIDGQVTDIRVDYGPYKKSMLNGLRGPSVETYLFENKLLHTPVLQLRQATWLASVSKKLGLSGHFVIGYPIIVKRWTHDDRVMLSKLALIIAIFLLLISIVASLLLARNHLRLSGRRKR